MSWLFLDLEPEWVLRSSWRLHRCKCILMTSVILEVCRTDWNLHPAAHGTTRSDPRSWMASVARVLASAVLVLLRFPVAEM